MCNELYFATSVFKYYAGDNNLIFKVIQPMFGTFDKENKVFTNFNKKEYFEIIDKRITLSDERIGFYNLVKLSTLEEEYNTKSLDVIVTKFFERYKNYGYHYDGVSLIGFDYLNLNNIIS